MGEQNGDCVEDNTGAGGLFEVALDIVKDSGSLRGMRVVISEDR